MVITKLPLVSIFLYLFIGCKQKVSLGIIYFNSSLSPYYMYKPPTSQDLNFINLDLTVTRKKEAILHQQKLLLLKLRQRDFNTF